VPLSFCADPPLTFLCIAHRPQGEALVKQSESLQLNIRIQTREVEERLFFRRWNDLGVLDEQLMK
jgi:hypothetical protein